MDFGKLVDLDSLRDEQRRTAFFRYEREAAARCGRGTKPCAWCGCGPPAGVLCYSLARGLADVAAHGYRRLAEFETA